MRSPRVWWVSRLARRAWSVVHRRSLESAMEDEMRYHIECEIAERVGRGMSAEEARRTAIRDFGGIERHKEDGRDARGARPLEDAVRDARYASRVLRRNPTFVLAVVATFAVGIGCTSAIFSMVSGILLRPLPYSDPAHLVTLWERNDARRGSENVVSVPTFEAWQQRARSFGNLAALVPQPLTLDGQPAERLTGTDVSPNYFRILGVHPAIGRDFDSTDALNGGANVVILSDALWKSRYGADPLIVGRVISIDGRAFSVIGVMPAGFDPPQFGWIGEQPLWLPFAATADNRSWGRFLHVVARLSPGVSLAQARSELLALSNRLSSELRDNVGWSATANSLARTITGDVRTPLIVVFTAVALLLLMATVNVASLVTTFTRTRGHELALRRAMGASTARLIRQQLIQSALLGFAGTTIGLALAVGGTRILVALAPTSVPRLGDVRVDAPVVAFACIIAIISTIAFGIVAARPAIVSRGIGMVLVGSSRTTTRSSGSRIIAAEIAIGLVLTVLAALMVRSLAKLREVDLGFDARSVIAGRVSLSNSRYPDDDRRRAFFNAVLTRVRAIPGVSDASLVTSRPFACCAPSTSLRDPASSVPMESAPIVDVRYADESFFRTMRIPVLAGNGFERSEAREGVVHVVISRSLARSLWGDASAIGRTVSLDLYGTTNARVIGVVGDVHLADPHRPIRGSAYLSTDRYPSSERDIVVRGTADPNMLITALRSAVASVDPGVPLFKATSMEAAVSETLAADRFTTALLGAFAVASLFLAAIGVYGVLAGDVSRRRKEIGIRLALGASGSSVTSLVLARAMRPAIVGAAVGVLVGLTLSRSMSALVFGVGTSDPLSFVLVSIALLVVAGIATLLPALRATRVSPVEAIRTD